MPADTLQVRKVETRGDFRAFFEFPWTLYKDDPNWVPPLLSQRRHLLDKQRNPSWQYLEGEYFVAWRGSRPVGTIAAFINHRHNAHFDQKIGWFGCFECYNDPEAARALLARAAEHVLAAGPYTAIRGPANFTLNDECGVLIENFSQPLLLMPYNPPYYQQLIEASGLGFEKIQDVVSVYTDQNDWLDENGRFPAKLERVVEKVQERKKIAMRQADMQNLRAEVALLREIYEQAWAQNWGFVPPTDAEMETLFKALRDYFNPELGWFALVDGDPAGFMLGLPDMNQVLKHAYPRPGEPEPWTLLKALWHWKIRPKITRQRIVLFGVKPQYRWMGVDAAIYMAYLKSSLRAGLPVIDAGWILDDNLGALNQVKMFGARIYKRYRFYEKALG